AVAEVGLHDFFANFSRSETFSYTTLEALSRGVVPLVMHDSPMGEFFPSHLRQAGGFRDGPHRTEQIEEVLRFWVSNYVTALPALQARACELTLPNAYAAAYADLDRPTPHPGGFTPCFSGADVSILM